MNVRPPTFLYIGPDKAGSSWMYNVLRRHPHCFIPPAKDLYFFDRYYDRGIDWYLSQFQSAQANTVAIGELSHDYLYSDAAAERISKHLPHVNLLVCLRNPVHRSYSQFLYLRRSGEVGDSFKDAIEKYPKIIDNSRYMKHLTRYLSKFPREQLKILLFDDLVRDSVLFGSNLLEMLALKFDQSLPFSAYVREASEARHVGLAKILKRGANFARSIGLSNVVGLVKHSSIAGLAYKPLTDVVPRRLSADRELALWEHFEGDLEALSILSGRDLSAWRSGQLVPPGES